MSLNEEILMFLGGICAYWVLITRHFFSALLKTFISLPTRSSFPSICFSLQRCPCISYSFCPSNLLKPLLPIEFHPHLCRWLIFSCPSSNSNLLCPTFLPVLQSRLTFDVRSITLVLKPVQPAASNKTITSKSAFIALACICLYAAQLAFNPLASVPSACEQLHVA